MMTTMSAVRVESILGASSPMRRCAEPLVIAKGGSWCGGERGLRTRGARRRVMTTIMTRAGGSSAPLFNKAGVVASRRENNNSSTSSGRGRGRGRVAVVTRAADDDRTSAARARLDAIKEEDELDVEDPGERGGFDMFSGGVYTPETLQNWELKDAFFYPRALLFGATALGLAASIPQSLGGLFRGDDDALFVLAANLGFFVLAAGFTAVDLKNRKAALDRLQRELALGDMQVIQRDKFRNERVFPLQSLRQAARVALVYGDAEKVSRDLAAATPFRRRLEQSRILVVPVVQRGPSDAGDAGTSEVGPGRWELLKDVVVAWPGAGAGRWLAWPTRNDAWAGYFRRLLASAGAGPEVRGGPLHSLPVPFLFPFFRFCFISLHHGRQTPAVMEECTSTCVI